MKILWIVNIVMPELADYLGIPSAASGSWLVDISNAISKETDIQLGVACIYGYEFKRIELNNKVFYVIPGNGKTLLFYSKGLEKHWQNIYKDFSPNLVHIHGTEYSHGLAFLRALPEVKSIISIQGMLSRIKDVDLGEIPARYFFFGQTYRQLVHFNGELVLHYLNKKNSKHEREMFERATAINGVSTWDTSIAKSFNKKLIIYRLDYNLRESFYTSRKWDANKIKVHSVFTNPGNAPLKGLHILIKACALLIDDYPDIEVIVPGLSSENGSVRVTSAYTRYLYKLIKRLNMAKHIRFLGKRTEKEMVADILSAHVVVIPSAIEGASLILHEAMHLGAPCISTFRGGMADFVADKEDGYLYDYPEYTYLAERICELFSDRARCCAISSNAIEKAEKAHERNKNLHEYVDMYHGVLSKGEK